MLTADHNKIQGDSCFIIRLNADNFTCIRAEMSNG